MAVHVPLEPHVQVGPHARSNAINMAPENAHVRNTSEHGRGVASQAPLMFGTLTSDEMNCVQRRASGGGGGGVKAAAKRRQS